MKDRNNLKYKILSQQWLILLLIIYCIELIRDIAWPLSHLHSIHE